MTLNVSLSLLRTNTASTVPHPGINPYCIWSISTISLKRPSKTFSYSLKACSKKLYSPIRVWIKGIPFLLNIGTNELNIHCSGNLSYDKILNMFVKDFKNLSPPALNDSITTPEGPLAFLIFIWFIAHFTSSTSILLTTPSTLLASML